MKKSTLWIIVMIAIFGAYSAESKGLLNAGAFEADMVTVPAGNFQMGSDDGNRDERPIHSVHINSFKISKYELTQTQWVAVMGGNPSKFRGATNPIENINWNDIQKFLSQLNHQTGKHFRLPTEAEWEYAARAGSNREYSWGDHVESNKANCDGCGSQWDNKTTAPVGSFEPNTFGLYDMHGNVAEWVQDCWNNSYRAAPVNGSAWLSGTCAKRVLRGGSWLFFPNHMRSAYRHWSQATHRDNRFGFRLVQD